MTTSEDPAPFKWVGGDLSLDFNNTVDWIGLEPQAGEKLTDYGRLVAWAQEGGVVNENASRSLLAARDRRPEAAHAALESALRTRGLIHRIFFRVLKDPGAVREDLERVNELLAKLPAQLEYDEDQNTFSWAWETHDPMTGFLQPVVWSASRLLTSPDIARVKTCTNEDCGWLFLDTSRKHNRKWCEMAVCGNRAKARRFYQRSKRRTTS
jgi:predicted RNA-binding Zn ribbon-like protein